MQKGVFCVSAIRKLCTMALLIALSIVLFTIFRFPPFPVAANHLEYDMADVPILIGSFMFGPVAGLMLTLFASVIQGLTVSAQSGPVGILMHIIATGAFAVSAGTIYKYKKTYIGAIIALVCGTLAMAAVMVPANLIITVRFYNVPYDVVKGMLLPVIIPFNLLKAGMNSVIVFILYKPVKLLFMPKTENKDGFAAH